MTARPGTRCSRCCRAGRRSPAVPSTGPSRRGRLMHSVDQTTEQMVRSVLAYAENRLRMDPVPLDKGTLDPARAARPAATGVIRDEAAPARRGARRLLLGDRARASSPPTARASSASSRRRRPRPACCSTCSCPAPRSRASPGWRPPARSPRRTPCCGCSPTRPGMPPTAGGCFVSGGSAGNLSALAVARETAQARLGDAATGRPLRVVVGTDAHSSIVNTLRLLEMDALVVRHRRPPADRRDGASGDRAADPDVSTTSSRWSAPRGPPTPASSTTSPGSGRSPRSAAGGSTSTAPTAGPGIFAPSLRPKYDGIEQADSFILDPHKWLFTPFDCCALLYREPELARATHTQDASYLDVIHDQRRRVEPDRLRLPPDPAGARAAAVVLARRQRRRRLPRGDRGRRRPGPGDRGADPADAAPRADPRAGPRASCCSAGSAGSPTDYDALGAARCTTTRSRSSRRRKWEGETVGRFAFLHPDTTLDVVREVLARTR